MRRREEVMKSLIQAYILMSVNLYLLSIQVIITPSIDGGTGEPYDFG